MADKTVKVKAKRVIETNEIDKETKLPIVHNPGDEFETTESMANTLIKKGSVTLVRDKKATTATKTSDPTKSTSLTDKK